MWRPIESFDTVDGHIGKYKVPILNAHKSDQWPARLSKNGFSKLQI